MVLNVAKEVAALRRMTARELRARYAEAFGEETRSGNKAWLVKRIAWRLQANAEGDISERARRRAEELANDADLRLSPPKAQPPTDASDVRAITTTVNSRGDDRLPPAGTILVRLYKGQEHRVHVLAQGFEHEGEHYRSLTAVAKAITGQHWSGHRFFRLTKEGN